MGNQDIYLKLLTQGLSGGAMRFLGVEGVELTESLPIELPAGTLRVDTVWRMVDGRLFHLEFQTSRESSLERFLEYDTRLVRRFHTSPYGQWFCMMPGSRPPPTDSMAA